MERPKFEQEGNIDIPDPGVDVERAVWGIDALVGDFLVQKWPEDTQRHWGELEKEWNQLMHESGKYIIDRSTYRSRLRRVLEQMKQLAKSQGVDPDTLTDEKLIQVENGFRLSEEEMARKLYGDIDKLPDDDIDAEPNLPKTTIH